MYKAVNRVHRSDGLAGGMWGRCRVFEGAARATERRVAGGASRAPDDQRTRAGALSRAQRGLQKCNVMTFS